MNLKVKVAVCALNQWALDFEGNCGRIKQSIEEARRKGATYRLGSELEITGFGCDDHFYEGDTLHHSWEVLAELLQMEESKHMICDVSMPVVHKNSRYNCRVIFMYKKLILIRPKLACCNQGNYRELRWFVPWFKKKSVEDFVLPVMIQEITGQVTIPIGDAVISTRDTCLGSEICEELWTADSSHVSQALDGVEIFTNGSASHFNLRKIQERMDLVKTATAKVGGAYLYANQHGCDGGRLYYDGCSMIAINGNLVACGAQFSMRDIDICFATFDLSDIRSFRGERSSMAVSISSHSNPYPRVCLHDFVLARCDIGAPVSAVIERPVVFGVAEEIEFGPACWLWDYLRRSGMSGFFLPLSGGIDSSSVACIVYSMCEMVCKEIESGNELVLADVRRVVKNEEFRPKTPQQLCGEVLTTCYMASENSSEATRARATGLASHIGATHLQLKIDTVVNAFLLVFTSVTGFIPRFAARGGSKAENLALQNIQARCRMVMAYLCAQLLQWVKGRAGSLLVLGSSNVDEVLRGYYTKYDCSSADLNPIGGVNKAELKSFMRHCLHKYDIAPLRDIVQATPTAELEPLQEGEIAQSDEVDMGMTYDELTVYGRLRKLQRCGPFSMFEKLIALWRHRFSPAEVAAKVKHFFVSYAINRHKTTTLTPSMHAENYSPDDNRFDLRPFLYNTKWTWQFRRIDEVQAVIDKRVQAAKLLGQDDSEVD